jgi:anti-sigma regulatory factor (Ser/Thr protein kinase)
MFPELDIRLRPSPQAAAEARRSFEALRPAVPDRIVDEAILLVSEIVSNSVRHAGLDDRDAIEVHVRGTGSAVHVDVSDPGPGFDVERLPHPGIDSGWGLQLLARLSTRWGVERGDMTRVWFELEQPVSLSPRRGTRPSTTREVPDG